MKPPYKTKLLQNRAEHDAFLDLLKAEGVRSYLEIGSAWGGSLWRAANVLPRGSLVVSVDANPNRDVRASINQCVTRLNKLGYKAHGIFGNSTHRAIIERARSFAPFDCVFIDGDHSRDGVTKDWITYGGMGRMIVFHDIGWNDTWVSKVPDRQTNPMGVPDLWNAIKSAYRYQEIRLHKKPNYYGIGVIWR